MTSGSFGNVAGEINASVPARTPVHRGTSNGSLAKEHAVWAPRDRRTIDSPSIEPSASVSGFTWQASATCLAPDRISAARAIWSLTAPPRAARGSAGRSDQRPRSNDPPQAGVREGSGSGPGPRSPDADGLEPIGVQRPWPYAPSRPP